MRRQQCLNLELHIMIKDKKKGGGALAVPDSFFRFDY